MSQVEESRVHPKEELKHDICFTINGEQYIIGSEVPPWTRLVDYIRENAKLYGTKVLCREAGCGLCTVVVTRPDHERPGHSKTYSVNSCQTMVYSCDGWDIVTVESLGDRFQGYHPLQKALHGFAGTQCGFCSPGMIMLMYGQMANAPLTVSQVERSLDGNICRCTGYRPILDAFKSLATDAPQVLKDKLVDIEEAYKGFCKKGDSAECGGCKKAGYCSHGQEERKTLLPKMTTDLSITVCGVQWHRPNSIEGVYQVLNNLGSSDKVRLVVGNTGSGVFKNDGPYNIYLSTQGVADFYKVSETSPLILGANVSLTRAIEVFKQRATSDPGYAHLDIIAKHWQYVANVSVRNAGCWAGNLMLKYIHRGFPSDIFLTLLAADAELEIGDATDGKTITVNLEQFLNIEMSRKVILAAILRPLPTDTKLRTFKITPRAVNAHAYVNACIRMQLDQAKGYKVISKPLLLFGGIKPDFINASQTEKYLTNRKLIDPETLREAVQHLGDEVHPEINFEDSSPEYRRSLTQSLLYKAIVEFLGDEVSNHLRSAGSTIDRPVSSGEQTFDMNEDSWPVGEPIPKLESATQISGEAKYMDDIPALPNELHAAFVQSTVANAKIKSVNTDEAMKLPGVVDWISKKDIPGRNSFTSEAHYFYTAVGGPDPVFAEERVIYAGQSIGLILAQDRDTAVRAAKLVTVEYEDLKTPVLTIQQSVEAGRCSELMKNMSLGDFEKGIEESDHQLSGELSMGGQYHFNMEPHAARVIPTEDGYDVYCTTQWPSETQANAAMVLDIPVNNINISVRRLGGGYGSKLTRANLSATAAAVAARKTKRPVRIVTDLNTNMTYVGWREPYHSKYQVGFDNTGKLLALKVDITANAGHVGNESSSIFVTGAIQSTYYIPNYSFSALVAKTDTAANTYCRSPGFVEAVATIENIVEHVAHYLKKDPLEIRELNMVPPKVPRLNIVALERNVVQEDIFPLLKEKASLQRRKQEVEDFNKSNRWKKRGLSVIPMWHGLDYYPVFRYNVQVVIYEKDGTVAISHGGIEMGQGINTKVAQVAAYTLGIPLDRVVVKASDTMMGANSYMSGASMTSDICSQGVRKSCTSLRQRLDVVKEKLKEETGKDPSWFELIQKASAEDVDLSERCWTAGKELPERYDIWGATCLEVELDVLTGVYMIRRVDLIEDSGRSLSPYVDIGQVEGAFVMGLGFFTSEEVKIHPETGQKLSNGTWLYKPPSAHDIPVDFRITLLPNAKHPHGVLGSKATGEPPLCMAYSVVTALRQAISSFRADNGQSDWFVMDTPITVEKAHLLCGVNPKQFQLFT